MSCHGCATPFGFLKKEMGCPRCGFSFCKNCLRFKLPDDKNKMIPVCQVCYTSGSGTKIPASSEDLTRQWKETTSVIRTVRRLESLDNPAKPPITVYLESNTGRLANLQRGLAVEDQKIVQRLKELRSHSTDDTQRRRRSEPAEEEVAARLAKLRDQDPSASAALAAEAASSVLLRRKPETDSDLLTRLADQVEIDKKYDSKMTGDINERLAKLRGSDPGSEGARSVHSAPDLNLELDKIMDEGSEEEDSSEEKQIQNIINRFVSEVALDEKLGTTLPPESEQSSSPPLPKSDSEEDMSDDENICRICDEKRAMVECKECDGDIFCKACFKEFHLELGECHKSSALRPPRRPR